ncbi:hypothetical protein CcaCcLH18_14365 [Colletotrichum camelliae]|nr:hypothetical protein CcaCcLH18_14365 [Colletotrichum camelliae]
MGNAESRQFADALSSSCQGADDIGDQLQDLQFLSALQIFLRHVELVWDKLPAGVTDVIKQKFLPSFNSEKDIDAWVLHEMFHISRSVDDLPAYLHQKITMSGPFSRTKTQFVAARYNVWLVAFAKVQKQFHSRVGRSALETYLQEGQGGDKKVRKKCSTYAAAGERLEIIANEVGGCGALVCGLTVPSSIMTSSERFEKRDTEGIRQTVDRELVQRRNQAVYALLSVYEKQVCDQLDRQGRSKKRKRADQPTQILPQARTADNPAQLSYGRGEPTLETVPDVVPEAVPDTAIGQPLPEACSSSVLAFPGHYYAESDDISPPRAGIRHPSAAPPTSTTIQATPSSNWGCAESFSNNNNNYHPLNKRTSCAASSVGIPSSVRYAPGYARQQPETISNPPSHDVAVTPMGGPTGISSEPVFLPYHFDTSQSAIDLGKLPPAIVYHRFS